MFGFSKKDPFDTVVCKGRKLEGQSGRALVVAGLDMQELMKRIDASAHCSRIVFGAIYQRAGTLMAENKIEEQSYSARYDRMTKTLGIALHQGYMRQTLVLSTTEPVPLAAELGLSLEGVGVS
ncbi:hypothetical protein [Chitinimonas lacunae]|uniref:Uncharacterized protein n=1 Tax=Chitinimonas lacunae TaxID=1963018 RepID=A0ABV8ML75_9NEIS